MSKKSPQSSRQSGRRDIRSRQATDEPATKPTAQSAVRESLILPIAALVGLVLLTFGPVARFDFLNWDDNIHIYDNPQLLVGLGGIGYFWTHVYEALYVPLSYTAFGLLLSIAHVAPGAAPTSAIAPAFDPHVFHVANLALHALNAIGVFILLRQLTRRTTPSMVGAALFAVHPFQVESVAWISELRGLLGGLFCIWSLVAYLCACETEGERKAKLKPAWYAVALLLYICALLSKPAAAALGLIVICLRVGMRRAPIKTAILEALPFLACAVPIGLVSSSVQTVPSDINTSLWQRPFICGDALAFYLAKLFVPIRMAIDYGRKPPAVLSHAWAYATWLAPVAVGLVLVRFRRAFPEGAVGALIAVLFLLPVLGLVPFIYQGYSTVADRYMYLAMIGLALIVAAALARAESGRWRIPAYAFAACVIVALAVASSVHERVWQNSADLCKAELAVNPKSYEATTDLGAYYIIEAMQNPRGGARIWGMAVPPLQQAIRNDPTDFRSIMDLGDAYRSLGRYADAEATYRQGLAISPDDLHAHFGLGVCSLSTNQITDAIAEFQTTVSLAHADINATDGVSESEDSGVMQSLIAAQGMLGDAYMATKQFGLAAQSYQSTVDIAPTNAYAWTSLGIANQRRGDYADAVTDFTTAMRYSPSSPQLERMLDDAKRHAPAPEGPGYSLRNTPPGQ